MFSKKEGIGGNYLGVWTEKILNTNTKIGSFSILQIFYEVFF